MTQEKRETEGEGVVEKKRGREGFVVIIVVIVGISQHIEIFFCLLVCCVLLFVVVCCCHYGLCYSHASNTILYLNVRE